MNLLKSLVTRRRFLQAGGAAGVAGVGAAKFAGFTALSTRPQPATAQTRGETRITKNICAQCPARCGIDVYTTDGKVTAIYGDKGNPIANGKLCPKGHLGAYFLYDPDRFTGPMKRTNPNKGRDEDPEFVPISWDEALDMVAERMNSLRERGESHRFAHFYGRGWGSSDAGLYGDFGKLYGTPNSAIGHASICAEGSKRAKQATDGNNSYNAYDYRNCNYILNFGAGFLEAFRPYNYLMQMWGHMRTKSPRTQVTSIDVRMNPTMAASDRYLMIKPATDGALALAIAHVILTEDLWDKEFVGDFAESGQRFQAGQRIESGSFEEKWVHGLETWWNEELLERTPEWAASITGIPARDIVRVAREFGTTRPAIALMERGPTAHFNGTYNGMAIHALNALVGSLFAEGGLFYQMGPSYGALPVNADDFMDDHARQMQERIRDGEIVRIDKAGTEAWPMTSHMMQEVAGHHLAGDPYKLDTAMFFYTNPIWTAPDPKLWEEALKDVFIIDTSPFPGETAMYADLILPEHTYLERLQDSPTYPFEGWPMAALRVPAVDPIHDTRHFGDMLIEIGKRINGPMGDYYRELDSVENLLRHRAAGFADDPGDNGVNDFESWKEKGVWYKKPYHWRQFRGEFYAWDGEDYTQRMSPEEVKEKLIKTPSGKFEFVSGFLENHAAYIHREMGIPEERVSLIQWVEARHTGEGKLHFVTPKVPLHAEGRSANIPQAISYIQPMAGGRGTVFLEIHPQTARDHGIRNGDRVRLTAQVRGESQSILAVARFVAGNRPDTLVLPMEYGHWAQGRWATGQGRDRLPGHSGEITENQSDPISGLACYYTATVNIERA
ncbi:molybdopterin-dependent oxidoreductase [Ectothiorhodospira sp. BSL-9]|uniref:molybdopterin-dependent oxidoreductase n=1 Tax=Ectothiorhodospira sp. BSL-9 TaxID=1442136 RepID=UPI0007B43FE0|nr:molybdopterin-dependent oxidoreductase [Ectothiorhodospira sp. BSL-9]ANB03234.1 anaerobic arsenite oxidase molybdopterin containing subunit ArxA [Ectothiorhodospira sp. BSL-9]